VQSFATQNGLSLKSGAPTLNVTLRSLRTAENIWHRSGYDARIVLMSRLRAASGKACWEEPVEGNATNYGYSGSVENYQITLNRALDAAMLHMVASPGFKDSLCHCAG